MSTEYNEDQNDGLNALIHFNFSKFCFMEIIFEISRNFIFRGIMKGSI
jgi:hypothetical protein